LRANLDNILDQEPALPTLPTYQHRLEISKMQKLTNATSPTVNPGNVGRLQTMSCPILVHWRALYRSFRQDQSCNRPLWHRYRYVSVRENDGKNYNDKSF
jgi:hypothetical protein